jgi:hypothetical protein
MNYQKKYLKYKNKYLKLKKSLEGGSDFRTGLTEKEEIELAIRNSLSQDLNSVSLEESEIIRNHEEQAIQEKQNYLELQQAIALSLGMKLTVVEGDGNCLFRCFAINMFGDKDRYNEVKDMIINEIKTNFESYSDFIIGTFEEYSNRISQDKAEGDNLEIQAYANLTRRCIGLYNTAPGRRYFEPVPPKKFPDKPASIFLIYTGQHYNFLYFD